MARKPRSDSASAAINAALNASLPDIEPPPHVRLRPEDAPFWSSIIQSRARDEWTKADLVVAAQLARCQRDIEVEAIVLENEGSVIENQRGTPVMNPRHAVLEQLSRREMAIMRSLQMGGNATNTRKDAIKKRELERKAREAHDEVAGTLLA